MLIGYPHNCPSVPSSMMSTLTSAHQSFFASFFQKSDIKIVIEVGAGIGRVTDFICEHLSLVYAIDTWDTTSGLDERTQQLDANPFETFCVNTWDARLRIIPIIGKSEFCLPFIAKRGVKPDAIYLDGDHTYEGMKRDINSCHNYFPYATIFGDDYAWESNGDRPIHRAMTYAESLGYVRQNFPGGIWTLTLVPAA